MVKIGKIHSIDRIRQCSRPSSSPAFRSLEYCVSELHSALTIQESIKWRDESSYAARQCSQFENWSMVINALYTSLNVVVITLWIAQVVDYSINLIGVWWAAGRLMTWPPFRAEVIGESIIFGEYLLMVYMTSRVENGHFIIRALLKGSAKISVGASFINSSNVRMLCLLLCDGESERTQLVARTDHVSFLPFYTYIVRFRRSFFKLFLLLFQWK